MKRAVLFLAVATSTLACGSPDSDENAIDAVMAPIFDAKGIDPRAASTGEICRRLFADLLGRSPTAAEVSSECKGRSVYEIAKRFQGREAYLLVSERHWRDRLRTTDVTADWRYLKELYARVDDLHRGNLRYDDFAEEVLTHPGFVNNVFDPEDRTRIAFEAFLGRGASDAEAADLASLWRPLVPNYEQDPDFEYTYRVGLRILPFLCDPLFACTAHLLGGGTIDMEPFDDSEPEGVAWEELDEAQRSAIREAGRVFTRQPAFWEAAADEILNRYLGWSDGGRFPREPGIVLPEVRQVLARHLQKTGSYPSAERLLLTSWLYRMSAKVEDDGFGDSPTAPVPEIYAHGPVKAGSAEYWLDTASRLTAELGTCDPRYTDGFSYFFLFEAYDDGTIDLEQYQADVRRLWEMQESRLPWRETEDGAYPNYDYVYVARLIGGCPGYQNQRQEQTGLAFAFTQESLAELLCDEYVAQNLAPSGEQTVAKILTHQMKQVFGRGPSAEEIADYEAAAEACEGQECTEAGLRNSICVGLLGSAEMIFY